MIRNQQKIEQKAATDDSLLEQLEMVEKESYERLMTIEKQEKQIRSLQQQVEAARLEASNALQQKNKN